MSAATTRLRGSDRMRTMVTPEGIALRASDIDVAAILGYNWPVFTGGPMFWGDTIGAKTLLEGLEALEPRYGADFTPAALVRTLADAALAAGRHQFEWDGRNDHGRFAASGVYYLELQTGAETTRRQLVRVR